MEPLLYRLLISCLVVWFVDQCLAKFGIGGSAAKIVQIVVLILAIIFILIGWSLNLGLK